VQPRLRETDLDPPVRAFLEARGYLVRSEVHGCDLVATRGEELLLVELKRGLGLELLMQALDRQRLSPAVYLAVPRGRALEQPRRWRGTLRLLRRLELGLLLVSFGRGGAGRVEAVLDPRPYDARKRRLDGGARRAVLSELAGRSRDGNQGGSRGRRLLTAYRESAIRIACALESLGPLSPRRLRELGTGPKTRAILADDHYGWFRRVSRGVYALRDGTARELAEWSLVTEECRSEISARVADRAAGGPG
jgi:hypothetical protein